MFQKIVSRGEFENTCVFDHRFSAFRPKKLAFTFEKVILQKGPTEVYTSKARNNLMMQFIFSFANKITCSLKPFVNEL